MKDDKLIQNNKKGWDAIADEWFGSTALPTYAPLMKTEDDLNLFGNIDGQVVLDIGCGSGHSLKYMGDKRAKELWGLDLSSRQILNAEQHLSANGYHANLFESPMEANPGIPTEYFDIVYSIYAFGWTMDLDTSLRLVSSYLKKGGMFVFSWDHPLTPCLDNDGARLVIAKSYHDTETLSMKKSGNEMNIKKWKLSSYIDGFKKHGLYLDTLVEDVDASVFDSDENDISKYYSKEKAKRVPLSIIIKAIKK